MKRVFPTFIVLTLIATMSIVSGCRAFNSDYSASPELQEMLSKPPPSPAVNKPKPADPSVSAPSVDYSVDKTECKTPEGVQVGRVTGSVVTNWGWAFPGGEGETVTVSAVKKDVHTATISIQKQSASRVVTQLSFTVKQTDADKFSACDFTYTEGESRRYSIVTGSVMIKSLNLVDVKTSSIANSGAFNLTFAREASSLAAQAVNVGATSADSLIGPHAEGTYFVRATSESAE